LDKIIFIPNQIPPHRMREEEIASPIDRYNMLKLALEDHLKFKLSLLELKKKGVSYTFSTIQILKKKYPEDELFFISAIDALLKYSWHKLDQILELLSKFLAAARFNFNLKEFNKKIKDLNLKNAFKIEVFIIPYLEISGELIRNKLKNKKNINFLVPKKVENYIIKNKLYQ
ncbi:MAG: nicotinate-nicotinamide nucleotide adenylyltransferase, partial [Armatimonadetes bacterium]|nr:nicotinate-nicotinamide nucleotide adenylyltransferase [Armatimonadota bacterium]